MYYGYDAVRTYNNNSKPIMLCEFEHAMGNSVGELKEYVDAFYAPILVLLVVLYGILLTKDYDVAIRSISILVVSGVMGLMMIISVLTALFFPIELYNLNYGKSNTNTAILLSKMWMFLVALYLSKAVFDFTNIGDDGFSMVFRRRWQKKLKKGTISGTSLNIPPLSKKDVVIPFTNPTVKAGSVYYLDLDFRLKKTTFWANAGFAALQKNNSNYL